MAQASELFTGRADQVATEVAALITAGHTIVAIVEVSAGQFVIVYVI